MKQILRNKKVNSKYNYKPSSKELYSSLKLRSKEYFLENTLHGVPYIVDPTRPKWERVTWFFLTMGSVIATIGIIVIIWQKFQTEPTITSLDTATTDAEIEYPQVFVCYDWTQLNHSILDKSDLYIYEELYNWKQKQRIVVKDEDHEFFAHKDDFSEIFEMIAPECESMMSNCTFNNVPYPCGSMFSKILTQSGACCKYNSSKPIKANEYPWELKFQALTYPLRIYLLDKLLPGPYRSERPMTEFNRPFMLRFIVEITYSVSNMELLGKRQRECHYPSEQLYMHACHLACTKEKYLEDCGCLPWYLKTPGQKECPLTDYSCIGNVFVDHRKCDCMLSCNYTSYVPVKFDLVEESSLSGINMIHWPPAFYRREIRFGYIDLLISFGGVAGLFLGYSLLTSVELGYYFSLRTYCGAVVSSSRKRHNIITVRMPEPKTPPKLDVKPVYYQYLN